MLDQVNDSVHVLRWTENITLKNTEQFRKLLNDLTNEKEKSLILNLANTSYINSAGLGIIAEGVMHSRKHNKELVIAELNDSVKEIFTIVKFATFMKLFDSEQDAIDYFSVKQDEQ